MAVGGQGAPLVPYLDRILLERHFVKTQRLGLLLNVGGISNISGYIPSSANSNENGAFIGFDCGPGTSYNYIMYTVNRCTLLFVLLLILHVDSLWRNKTCRCFSSNMKKNDMHESIFRGLIVTV